MVVIGRKWFYSGSGFTKVVVFRWGKGVVGQSGIRAKVVVFGQSGCIRKKVDLFGKKWFYSGKSGCNRAKVDLFGKKWFYSGKSGCIRARWLYFRAKNSGKMVVCIRSKWLYSGKRLYSG